MKVLFNDLTISTDQIRDVFLKKVEILLDQKNFILGPEVENFEKKWTDYIGTKYSVGVSSGADALYLALITAGIKPGDEVITQGNAYNASVTAIIKAGAVPRFVDIRSDILQIDTDKIVPLINEKTKAILPVHLYGQSGEIDKICEIAKKHNLVVIEDCAQAHGATYNGKKLGTFGLLSAFSFYPTKNLGAFGDAGAVMVNDENLHQELFARRNLGQTEKNQHKYFGTNMRLDPIQAIVLSLKLEFLEEVNKLRCESAEFYDEIIKSKNLAVDVVGIATKATSVRHLYVIKLRDQNRDDVQRKMKDLGVETAVHYPTPVYKQSFYSVSLDNCPITDDLSEKVLSLPIYYGITKEQQVHTIESLRRSL